MPGSWRQRPRRTTILIMTEEQVEVFNRPIDELELGDELKALLKEKGYATLGGVLAKPVDVLRNEEGLSFEQEVELFGFVKRNGLRDYWRE